MVLDGVGFIPDPLAPGAEYISVVIEQLGGHEHARLVTTSSTHPDACGFHRIGVPTLPEDYVRDAFYGLCILGRSSLSVNLSANSVRENDRDESTPLKAWYDDHAGALEKKRSPEPEGCRVISVSLSEDSEAKDYDLECTRDNHSLPDWR